MAGNVRADLEKNRLYICFGEISMDTFMEFADKILEVSKTLKPGFTVLSDLRNFRFTDQEKLIPQHINTITSIQKNLQEAGASETIRVVDPQVWLFNAMAEGEKTLGYSAMIFDDYDEATEALDDIAMDSENSD